MIEFLTGSIMPCERSLLLLFFFPIQMINVIRLVREQRTKCEVCQHPAITFISTGGGGGGEVCK